MEFKNLKQGEILSETQYYVVNKVVGDAAYLKPDSGDEIRVSKGYVNNFLQSGEQFSRTEKVNKTDLANLFLSNNGVAMTACFNKQVKATDVEKEIVTAYEDSTPKSFAATIKAIVKKALNGEERVITGRHNGTQDEFGRVHFVDMKLVKEESKDYDTRQRLVDPRTLNWLIVNNTKYTLK